jgi:acyl-CoA reductase-like NAD-dependent aldehyde dehydrogenase
MYDSTLFINGESKPAAGSSTFDRKNPVTGEVATRAAAADLNDVRNAIEAAAAAFPAGPRLLPRRVGNCL